MNIISNDSDIEAGISPWLGYLHTLGMEIVETPYYRNDELQTTAQAESNIAVEAALRSFWEEFEMDFRGHIPPMWARIWSFANPDATEAPTTQEGKGKGKDKEPVGAGSGSGQQPVTPPRGKRKEPMSSQEAPTMKKAKLAPARDVKGKGKEPAPTKVAASEPYVVPYQSSSPPNKRAAVLRNLREMPQSKKRTADEDPEAAGIEDPMDDPPIVRNRRLPRIPVSEDTFDKLEVMLGTGIHQRFGTMRLTEWRAVLTDIGYEIQSIGSSISATPNENLLRYRAADQGRLIKSWTQHYYHKGNPTIPMDFQARNQYSIRLFMQGKYGFGSQGLGIEDFKVQVEGEPDTDPEDDAGGGANA